jgi:hypothetical protein
VGSQKKNTMKDEMTISMTHISHTQWVNNKIIKKNEFPRDFKIGRPTINEFFPLFSWNLAF